ncbi:stellacyanin [Selaginella moellendorffii]|uniref:stellacyanin n=1 Tax=Selaginella moellendorffii TaxID=88036 RepID=UPI000D1CE66D|nr:stellacyanin [Selaginella moellendorffii]|eukprot:XP_002967653.2 stellacyanin [Selaginella moellendorffii]
MPSWRSSSSSALVVLLSALLFLASQDRAEAVQFVVGGSAGWTLPSFGHVNYTQWTLGNRYHLGDTLVFNYSKDFHNVLAVSKADFIACSTANPIATFQDGHTIINLDTTGPHFYVCGVPGHCGQGQKLLVVVRKPRVGRHHGPSPSPLPGALPAVRNPGNGPAEGPMSAASAVPWTWATAVLAVAAVLAL